jgi:hypothetical protein
MKVVLILIIVAITLLASAIFICIKFQKGGSELLNSKNKDIDTQKECNSCRQPINTSASICHHCGQRQSPWGKYFGDIAIGVSIVMVILATAQFLDARKKNFDASKALGIAKETVDQVRNIACVNAEAVLTASMAANFMGGMKVEDRLRLDEKVVASLVEIGISTEDVKKIKKKWSKGIGILYHNRVHDTLEGRTKPSILNMKASPELLAASKAFRDTVIFDQWKVPTPNEMQSFIEKKGFMNDTLMKIIDDYRSFLETGNYNREILFPLEP